MLKLDWKLDSAYTIQKTCFHDIWNNLLLAGFIKYVCNNHEQGNLRSTGIKTIGQRKPTIANLAVLIFPGKHVSKFEVFQPFSETTLTESTGQSLSLFLCLIQHWPISPENKVRLHHFRPSKRNVSWTWPQSIKSSPQNLTRRCIFWYDWKAKNVCI